MSTTPVSLFIKRACARPGPAAIQRPVYLYPELLRDATLVEAMKTRLDKALVERGLAASRERAQALILAGRVLVAEQSVEKPGPRWTRMPPCVCWARTCAM